ncbi:MAG TPA: alpha/beta hydrolase fold domain-containing protein, partial [Flavisolibacter sp.]
GGGFALALAQQAREESLPQPRDIILLSPWLDITLENPKISALEAEDHFLEKESLQQAGKLYAGDRDPDHYLLSPIYGSMEGLGRISLFIGTREMLLPDARKLKKLVQSKGMDINYYEYPDMFHDWMILDLPESKKARDEISKLIMK